LSKEPRKRKKPTEMSVGERTEREERAEEEPKGTREGEVDRTMEMCLKGLDGGDYGLQGENKMKRRESLGERVDARD